MFSTGRFIRRGIVSFLLAIPIGSVSLAAAMDDSFTIAVIPDTQNYVDYTHQRAQGFPFDASEIFLEQMKYVAANVASAGGDIAFVTSVGDMWQHQTLPIDPGHERRGFKRASNAFWDPVTAPSKQTLTMEMPLVERGYEMLADRVPFSVVPGNHDYDAMWTDVERRSATGVTFETAGTLRVGGLANFQSLFSPRSKFFHGKPWYIDSHDDGADSAQVFQAGGYKFLHIGLQFDAPDASLAWAAAVIRKNPGLPTIISTHNYLSAHGQRTRDPIVDNHATDPSANTPQMVWDKLISQHDQIFMVLCGHRVANGQRIEKNRAGHFVYQLLSDFQNRGQTAKQAGATAQLGDGWMRLMTFNTGAKVPTVRVRTYSTHYRKFSTDLAEYATWYKAGETPALTDDEFHARDDFVLELTDFRARFDRTRH